MATAAVLTENSRQGFEVEKPPCIGLEAELSRNPRRGWGHVYDQTASDLAVYVRNDPVNLADPDGKFYTCIYDVSFAPGRLYIDRDCFGYDFGGGWFGDDRGDTGSDDPEPDPAPTPCPFSAATLLSYMLTTPAYVEGKCVPAGSRDLATLGNAEAIMEDAVDANVDPRLMVAIAFVESKWGGTKGSQSALNAFGILNDDGKLRNYSQSGGWERGIDVAVDSVRNRMDEGLTTVAGLYSGKKGAYCVGNGCNAKAVEKQFTAQGGNAKDLTSPCYRDKDKYYLKKPH